MTMITHKGKVRNGAVTPMFISKWDTTQAGSANDTVVLPLTLDGDYDFFVEKLCEENDITVKQFKDYEKEYWENINKVKQGVFNVQSNNFDV